MCEPVTITALIAGGAALAGAGVSAYGAMQQGEAQKFIAMQNAQLAEHAAADALERGAQEQGMAREKGSLMAGRQQVGLTAAGVDPSQGSASNLLADSRLMNEVDVARIGNNAAREAWGYKVNATQLLAQGNIDEQRGQYGAFGSILGGIGSAASTGGSLMRLRPPGLPPTPFSMPKSAGAGDYSISSSEYLS